MPHRIKHATITFLECSFVGGWQTEVFDPIGEIPESQTEVRLLKAKQVWSIYRVWQEPAEIQLVRPDELIRRFTFRLHAVVYAGQTAIRFNQNDMIEEFSVDQDAQSGKRTKPTVVSTDDDEKTS